jgi:uncharacterized protein (UPF0210 family)
MKIRSITKFIPLSWPFDEGSIASAARFLTDARLRLAESGFEVQTVRLATPPFLDVIGDPDVKVLLDFAHTLERLANKYNIDYVSIGPVVATTPLSLLMSIHNLPQVISETEKIFSGVLFADASSGLNLAAAQAFAETVSQVAHSTRNGFGNLRLAALANVPPGVPFFPAAYHDGSSSFFAIAVEAADLALNAVSNAPSLQLAHKRLVKAIESTATQILAVVDKLVDDHQIGFRGIDFSLAPYPAQARSIGAAIESLGVDNFGGSGTLFVAAFLTGCIRAANIPHHLLLYSAVCGTGLDTIPIPGNTSPDEIGAIFLDLGALAIALNKPLTARLMPIPGKAVGQKISFDFEYFANSCVLPVKNLGARSLFERNSFFELTPIKSPRR